MFECTVGLFLWLTQIPNGTMTGMDEAPKLRRRRFQISLRTLLLLVTFCSALFGWLGIKVRQAQQQKEAIEAIEKIGGVIFYDYHYPGGDFNRLAAPPGPAWLRSLFGIDFVANVTFVRLSYEREAEKVVNRIGRFRQLKEAYLDATLIADHDMIYLRDLSALEYLYIGSTRITDAGLVNLRKMTMLKHLDLSTTEVTDAGLAELKGMTHLERLFLDRTNITDEGLRHLEGLTRLDHLGVTETRVTKKGVQRIRKALPKLVGEQ